MASEITVTSGLAAAKGGINRAITTSVNSVDMAGTEMIINTQVVGTTEEALLLGDVTLPGWVAMRNTGAAFIHLRRASGEGNCLSFPVGGPFQVFYLAATAPFVIAITSSSVLDYMAVEA